MLLHRSLPCDHERFLLAIAPFREDLVVAVECVYSWYWLADLCAKEGISFVLGHALYMKLIHGAKAKNDRIDSNKAAVLLRGGLMPQAYAYPADMRATRDLMRRRLHFVRQRGSLLAHIQITHHQYNLDAPGKRITYRSNREGLGEGFEDPSVRHSIAADLTLADHFEVVIGELELAVLRQARVHDPDALHLLTSVPGIGKILALTILYEIHDISRFPTVRDFASYSRLVKCEKSSAGKSLGNERQQDRQRLPQVGLLRGRRALRRQVRTGPHRAHASRAQVRQAQGAVGPRSQARASRLLHARPQAAVRPAALRRVVRTGGEG